MIIEKWNCKWLVTRYTTTNPDCLCKQRQCWLCVASNNALYPVGHTITCADK